MCDPAQSRNYTLIRNHICPHALCLLQKQAKQQHQSVIKDHQSGNFPISNKFSKVKNIKHTTINLLYPYIEFIAASM